MNKPLKIFLLLCFVSITTITYGQKNQDFPEDSLGFFESMETYLRNARPEGKSFMRQFRDVWYGGYFTESQRKRVYETTNEMLKKGYRPFPHFKDYLYTIGNFVIDKQQTEASFIAWQNTVSELLKSDKKREFNSFMEFSSMLFRENALYYSASNVWAANNNNYIFSYDSLPKLTFESLDLICYSRGDSMKIKNTSGDYYPTTQTWVGKSGKITWERAGMPEDEVYALVDDYQINTKYNYYTLDSVAFYNTNYFEDPLLGKLEEKLLSNMTPEKNPFPRFDSYTKRMRIENIFPDVNFDGGFSMRGAKLHGTGEGGKLAELEFYREDTLFLRAFSETFSIQSDRIISNHAAVSFYLSGDSISHPGLDFKFLSDRREVTLYREDQGVARTPYTNTFHQVEMSPEVVIWKMDEPRILLTNLKDGSRNTAYFSSINFFKEEVFEQIGGLDADNPLYQIQNMVNRYGTNTLSIRELSYFLNISDAATNNLIVRFTSMGFLTFNFDKNEFTVKQKLSDFVQSMHRRIDYDVLSIKSEISGKENGKINLLNYDLTINGIPGIILSDSQKVVILPEGGSIVMHKNRAFDFKGHVKAGRFDFYGKEFHFDYKNFKINLVNVDSMQMKAPTGKLDERGFPELKRVRSVIEGINGELVIDYFTNKSGIKDYPEYPIFTSDRDSYVYYNKEEVLGGAYNKNEFYFQVEPFRIDSLDDFKSEQLAFGGTFSSAGIFPDIKEELTLQEDFSLGFEVKTPTGGFPTYGGKGQFHDDISLSNRGLRGSGKLEYITSTTYSNDFIFYIDSMTTLAKDYIVEEQEGGPEYPPIVAKQTDMLWLPYQDKMDATTTSVGMEMYDSISHYMGTTTYSPSGTIGNGTYYFETADLKSNQFEFGYNTINSDTADFKLKGIQDSKDDVLTLKTDGVKAFVDFEERYADFKMNGVTPIELPKNQYICFMDEFKWFMDDDNIEFRGSSTEEVSADVYLEGSKFVSTKYDQDSLFFYSPLANYDSRNNIIKAEQVEYIHVADARVYPDSGIVTVLKKAEMTPLINSKIVANATTEFHNIYKANTKINGRKTYSASGYIDYKDRLGQTQEIYLSNIYTDTSGQTIGTGDVGESADFTLSPQFAYYGKVTLYANDEHLEFNGLTQISHECEKMERPWLRFKGEIDPDDIYIPIDSVLRAPNDAFIVSSLSLAKDSVYFYSGFLTPRVGYNDIKVLPAYGFLYYDKDKNTYKISSKEKINDLEESGNYLSLDVNHCKTYGEGLVDLGVDGGNMKFKSAGNINHTLSDDAVILDLMSSLEFFFDNRLMDMIADDISGNASLEPTDFMRGTFEKGLRDFIGEEMANELISQLSLNGRIRRMPPELQKNFVFNDLKMQWDQELRAYKSFGNIGISNINRKEVHKYVKGSMMITKSRGGDIIDFYIEASPHKWYYFKYRRNLLKVISSNEDFNQRVKDMKRGDRKYKNERGEAPFTYMFGVEREKEKFLEDFDRD